LSPETCRVKPLGIKNAIVASCWTYFTTIKHDAWNHKYKIILHVTLNRPEVYLTLLSKYRLLSSMNLQADYPRRLLF